METTQMDLSWNSGMDVGFLGMAKMLTLMMGGSDAESVSFVSLRPN